VSDHVDKSIEVTGSSTAGAVDHFQVTVEIGFRLD